MSKILPLDVPVLEIIERDFQGLYSGELGLSSIKGGQTAADQALATLDITGYAAKRSEVLPRVGIDPNAGFFTEEYFGQVIAVSRRTSCQPRIINTHLWDSQRGCANDCCTDN